MTSLLVIGGARSGKSGYAQKRAEATGLAPVFIATAQAFDKEMSARIARHRADRGPEWTTIEAPIDLPQALAAHCAPDRVVLVDCLTLWISNLLMAEQDIDAFAGALISAVESAKGALILVSNEVGWGIVPENALARRFRDEAGLVNQKAAQAVAEVQLVVAGLPTPIK